MGVYIDGLEMPTSCNKCPFTCEALQFFNGKGRPQSCPLIEISETKYHNMVVALDILEHEQTDEEWYDWRDKQEYEDRWERRTDDSDT